MANAINQLKFGLPGLIRAMHRVILNGTYQPEVDGLRFIAITFVIFGHVMEHVVLELNKWRAMTSSEIIAARLLPAAQTGVLLFFAISGYILAAQFKRRWQRKERIAYGAYFQRRLVRIAPPYLLVLVAGNIAVWFMPTLGKTGTDHFLAHLIASLLYVHGLVFGELPRGFPPGWSLELEVQFYLVAPFLFFAYFRLRPTGRELIAGILTTMLLGVWVYVGQFLFGEFSRYYFTLPKFIVFFWVGFWLADLYPAPIVDRPRAFTLLDAVGFLALASLAALGTFTHFISSWPAVATIEVTRTLMILFVFIAAIRGQAFRRLCSARIIAFFGSACYSFYLVHLQLVEIFTSKIVPIMAHQPLGIVYAVLLAIEVPIILLAGMAFYIIIERPFQLGNPLANLVRLRASCR